MIRYRQNVSKRRLDSKLRQSVATPLHHPIATNRGRLEIVGQVAQIALAVVAIFGYFYTVQPTYQKERLAEQVAEYDGIIKKQTPKIAEIENRLAELQRERTNLTNEIQQERSRLSGELRHLEGELSVARIEKNKVEAQIQYMTFRYRLPDGRPAVTGEQVKVAQIYELKQSYLSALQYSCVIGLERRAFPSYSYAKYDEKSKSWPFSDRELDAWKESGTKYPLIAATECITSTSKKFAERHGKNGYADVVENLRTQAVQYANHAAEKNWAPSMQPAEIRQALITKQAASDVAMKADLKKVEQEYGDWESTFGEARRAIFKHNYHVGKTNAEMQALGRRMSMEYEAQQQANEMRKSIETEIKRLIISNFKNETKSSQGE